MFKKSLVIMARALLAAWLVSSISACAKKTPASSTSTESAATATATSSMAAVPAKMTPSDLWKLMGKKLTYIQEGHHGPVIYDFTDTNCPFCHLIYVVEARLIREGKLTVRYVPVAIIKPSSMPEAAASWHWDRCPPIPVPAALLPGRSWRRKSAVAPPRKACHIRRSCSGPRPHIKDDKMGNLYP